MHSTQLFFRYCDCQQNYCGSGAHRRSKDTSEMSGDALNKLRIARVHEAANTLHCACQATSKKESVCLSR